MAAPGDDLEPAALRGQAFGGGHVGMAAVVVVEQHVTCRRDLVAGNRYLMPTLHRVLIDHTRMSHVFYRPRSKQEEARVDTSCAHHDEIILAIERGEAARAVQITLDHWELTRHEIELYVRCLLYTSDAADE